MPPDSEDLYGDAQDSQAPADKPTPKDGDDDGSSTSILPRSFFAGKDLKVGDKVEATVTAIHENDVEVSPTGSGDDEQPEEDDEPSDTPPPAQSGGDAGGGDGSMASMMQ